MHKSLRSLSPPNNVLQNSQNTLSYDMQVKEMEEMKFSRKLTQK